MNKCFVNFLRAVLVGMAILLITTKASTFILLACIWFCYSILTEEFYNGKKRNEESDQGEEEAS